MNQEGFKKDYPPKTIDYVQIEQKLENIFSNFINKIMELEMDSEDKIEFLQKYSLIFESFSELKDKLDRWFEYATANPNLEQSDFENALGDLEKIFSTLGTAIESDYGQKGNFEVRNIGEGENMKSSQINHKDKNIMLRFNFEPSEQNEARAGISYKDERGKEYALRFDLDKKMNAVACDVQSENLDKLFMGVKEGESHGHHFKMDKLTNLVYEKDENGNLNITEKFRGVVANFKDFLMESPQKEHATLADLMAKFNSEK